MPDNVSPFELEGKYYQFDLIEELERDLSKRKRSSNRRAVPKSSALIMEGTFIPKYFPDAKWKNKELTQYQNGTPAFDTEYGIILLFPWHLEPKVPFEDFPKIFKMFLTLRLVDWSVEGQDRKLLVRKPIHDNKDKTFRIFIENVKLNSPYDFAGHIEIFLGDLRNYREIGFQKAEKDAIDVIKSALEIDKFNLRFLNMFGVEFYDPDFVVIGALGPNARSEGSRLWKQKPFKAKMTTLDKVNEIKSYFDVSGDYAMYMCSSDNQLIAIPVDSETNLADWLKDRHHSIDSKIYIAPSSLTIEQFHTYDNWKDHPTYKLCQDMKALLGNMEPNEVNYPKLNTLLGNDHSNSIFYLSDKILKNGINYFFSDNVLYRWIYNIDENRQFPDHIKKLFRNLLMDYRQAIGLSNQDPDIDNLIGELRLAIQFEPDFVSSFGPLSSKLMEYFGLGTGSYIFKGKFQIYSILTLLYGLYRRSNAEFMLINLGESQILDSKGASLAAQKALLAINRFCVSKNILPTRHNLRLKQRLRVTYGAQDLSLLITWFLSDIHGRGSIFNRKQIESLYGLNKYTIGNFITGKQVSTRDIDFINKLRALVSDLSKSLRGKQSTLLRQVFNDFYAVNARIFPGVHGVKHFKLPVISLSREIDYHSDWKNPDVVAKHMVELLIRQGGLLPAGKYGEGADDYNVLFPKFRHHIDFYKDCIDVIKIILLGNLHYKFTKTLEPIKNLDYYTRMRVIRDSFENAIPPSFWEPKLQDLYIKLLKEFITGWEIDGTIQFTSQNPTYVFVDGKWVKEKVDFIKINYRDKTYNLQEMLDEGWITEDWIDDIIQDLRQKLESRGLM